MFMLRIMRSAMRNRIGLKDTSGFPILPSMNNQFFNAKVYLHTGSQRLEKHYFTLSNFLR